jgi:hypothetical protein
VAGTVRGNENSAYNKFLDRSHAALHVIAGAAQSKDRRIAARMLVAMESLEATFNSSGSTKRAASQTKTLIQRTNDALDLLHIDPVQCP